MAMQTSRWSKRKAAQTMSGRTTKGTASGSGSKIARPKTNCVRPSSSTANTATSAMRMRVHGMTLRRMKERMSGVTMIMPQASPCHQVHQL